MRGGSFASLSPSHSPPSSALLAESAEDESALLHTVEHRRTHFRMLTDSELQLLIIQIQLVQENIKCAYTSHKISKDAIQITQSEGFG